ncbi:MAG TPA: hypothetical protein VFD58_01210 [Blastocatellia bacterium]|nr:hypothetical protein [Blastocatellia bacterium]
MSGKSPAPDRSGKVFILAGTSHEYSIARRKLGLNPAGAFWLAGPKLLAGLKRPKVYRYGTWQTLARIKEIEEAMRAADAEVIELT